jgi:tetrahydromethanopterin S-methyltransferase subunit B
MTDDEIRERIEYLENEINGLRASLDPEPTTQYRTHSFLDYAAITVSMTKFKPVDVKARKKLVLTLVK